MLKTRFRNFKENIIIALFVIGMLMVASLCLFLLTKDDAFVAAVDVNNQNNQTASPYLTFDAGFGASKDAITHSSTLDVDVQEPKFWLYLATTAGGCTIYNPTFQFLTETGGTNINFDIGFDGLSLTDSTTGEEFVKSSSKTNKTVVLKDLNGGISISLRARPDFESSTQTNQTCIVRFSGTLQDPSGNTTAVSKDIYVNVGWTQNTTMELEQRVSKYKRNHNDSTLTIETTLVNQVKRGTTGYTLPVKQTELVVDAPTYIGIAPTSVSVVAKRTTASNGKDENEVVFNSSNYSYDSANRKLTIRVNNTPDASGNIARTYGTDEYIITYTYPKAAYDAFKPAGTTIKNSVKGTMTLSSNTSTTNITKTINDNFTVNIEFGVDKGLTTKLGLYMNALSGNINWNTTIGGVYSHRNSEVTNIAAYRMEFGELKFHSGSNTYSGYDNKTKTNYNPISQIAIPQDSFIDYLGNDGYIKVYDDNCTNLIGTITTSTPKNVYNQYEFQIPQSYQSSSRTIVLETSAPKTNLKTIEIYHDRIITGGTLTLKQAQEITSTSSELKSYVAKTDDPTNFTTDNQVLILDQTDFAETYTDASLNVETIQLDASNSGYQELKLKVMLDNISSYSDAWSNPYFDIELPEYITEAKDISVQLNDSRNITYNNKNAITTKDGKYHLIVACDGTQQQTDKKTSVEISCKVKVDKYAANSTKDVTLRYVNQAFREYKNESNWLFTGGAGLPNLATGTKAGITTGEIKFVNDPTLLCIAELNIGVGEKINSIDNPNGSMLITRGEETITTMNLTIQNNHTVPVSNIAILGRIPYTNNKSAITNTDLGTNINAVLEGLIIGIGNHIEKNIIIYYSDNLDATQDISLASNNWVIEPANLSTIKSYLIVINDTLDVGENIKFSYNFKVPAESKYNKQLYANFGAYYTADGVAKTAETPKIGLTTGSKGKLNVIKTGTLLNGGDTAREGDIIKYTIQIQNNSDSPVENVVLSDRIPEHTSLIHLNGDGTYIKEDGVFEFTENIGTINAHDSKEITFYVVVEEITENMNIENTATVTADGMDPEPSNTSSIPAVPTSKEAQLEVTKTSSIPAGGKVKEGDIIEYKIVAKNVVKGIAKNIVIKDNIPENTIYYDEATKKTNSEIKTVNSDVKEALNPGESFEFIFKVQVGRIKAGTTIKNTATVVGDNVPETPSNTEGINADITEPNLRLKKESSIETGKVVKEGDTITYKITVYNDGKTPAYDVEIKDKVPQYTTYYENNKRNKEIVDVGKTIAVLEPGKSETYTFTVIVEEIPKNGMIKNTATAKGENGSDVKSNVVGINAEISKPELKIEKTSSVEAGKTISSGEIIEYTIVVTNTGDCIAHNVVIKDEIPQYTTYAEKKGNNKYVKDESKKEITKTIEALNPGESETLTFCVMVDGLQQNVQINNTAKVNANNGKEVKSNTVGISAKVKETTKGGELPNTGTYSLMIILSVAIISLSVFAVYEYKRIKR